MTSLLCFLQIFFFSTQFQVAVIKRGQTIVYVLQFPFLARNCSLFGDTTCHYLKTTDVQTSLECGLACANEKKN